MKQFNLAEWALKHKSIIYYFMAVLLTFGVFSYSQMGRMEDPDFTMRTMVVGVAWPGASPQEISDQVTDKLEEKLRVHALLTLVLVSLLTAAIQRQSSLNLTSAPLSPKTAFFFAPRTSMSFMKPF